MGILNNAKLPASFSVSHEKLPYTLSGSFSQEFSKKMVTPQSREAATSLAPKWEAKASPTRIRVIRCHSIHSPEKILLFPKKILDKPKKPVIISAV
jgi:hypothetical protein